MKESAKIFLLILFICLSSTGSIFGQIKLSSADSLYYMSHFDKCVPSDLPILRQLAKKLDSPIAILAQLKIGYLAYKEKNYDQALKEFDILIKAVPKCTERYLATYFKGVVYRNLKNYAEAIKYFIEYESLDPNGEKKGWDEWNRIGCLDHLDSPGIIQEMQKFINNNSDNLHENIEIRLLERYYYKNLDYQSALNIALQFSKDHPKSANNILKVEISIWPICNKLKNLDIAADHFKKLVSSSDPKSEVAAIGHYYLGAYYNIKNLHEQAVNEYEIVLWDNPDKTKWSDLSEFRLADSYYLMGKKSKNAKQELDIAAEKFNKFLQKNDNYYKAPEVYTKLADIYSQKGDYDNALNFHNKLLNYNKALPNTRGQVQKDKFDKKLRKATDYTLLAKANVLRNGKKQPQLALVEIDNYLSRHPERRDILILKAATLYEAGDKKQAQEILNGIRKQNVPEKEFADKLFNTLDFSDINKNSNNNGKGNK